MISTYPWSPPMPIDDAGAAAHDTSGLASKRISDSHYEIGNARMLRIFALSAILINSLVVAAPVPKDRPQAVYFATHKGDKWLYVNRYTRVGTTEPKE